MKETLKKAEEQMKQWEVEVHSAQHIIYSSHYAVISHLQLAALKAQKPFEEMTVSIIPVHAQ